LAKSPRSAGEPAAGEAAPSALDALAGSSGSLAQPAAQTTAAQATLLNQVVHCLIVICSGLLVSDAGWAEL
jgi:hypothetical protein